MNSRFDTEFDYSHDLFPLMRVLTRFSLPTNEGEGERSNVWYAKKVDPSKASVRFGEKN
jgi:hypothetical protein